MKIAQFIEKRFWIFMTASMALGVIYPIFTDTLMAGLELLIMVMLFLVFLKLDLVQILRNLRRIWLLLYLAIMYLLIIPMVIYFFAGLFDETIALGLLLLAAMPAGIASPALTDLVKGNTALSTSIVVVTSLLAPFSIPFLFNVLTPENISIDTWGMFQTLTILIFVPIVLSQIIKNIFPKVVEKSKPALGAITVILISLTNYAILGSQREIIINDPLSLIWQLVILYLVCIFFHVIGYLLGWRLPRPDKISTAVTKAYLNGGMAIVLAASFFAPNILLMMVLSSIPWNTLLAPFRWTLKKLNLSP
ncbi:MAG: bile acid:sodium symporter [Parcubacteria group bacterium]|nr:bile acid:sodium symporter [Parcubacteria group bacterium]